MVLLVMMDTVVRRVLEIVLSRLGVISPRLHVLSVLLQLGMKEGPPRYDITYDRIGWDYCFARGGLRG